MQTAFSDACTCLDAGDLSTFEEVLDRFPRLLDYQRADDSLIHYGFSCGEEVVRRLVVMGVNVNARDSIGGTVLMLYSAEGNVNMVKFMLDHGANPNIATNWRETALSWAVCRSEVECAQILFEFGADIHHVLGEVGEKRKELNILGVARHHANESMLRWIEQRLGIDLEEDCSSHLVGAGVPHQKMRDARAMDGSEMRELVQQQIADFSDPRAIDAVERWELFIEPNPIGWLLYRVNEEVGIAYALSEGLSDMPWGVVDGFNVGRLSARVYCYGLEDAVRHVVYNGDIPPGQIELDSRAAAMKDVRKRLMNKKGK